MNKKAEFEFITHEETAYKLFLVNMVYRTPHIHKDFEVCLLLDGEISLFSHDQPSCFKKGDFWVMNPFESHELKAAKPALLLALQISPSFFAPYYPQIDHLHFHAPGFSYSGGGLSFTENEVFPNKKTDPDKQDLPNFSSAQSRFFQTFLHTAYDFFKRSPRYELRCAGSINLLFDQILELYPHEFLDDRKRNAYRNKAERIRTITDYIDRHYDQKLLLSQLAQQEGLTLTYLSHFFKDSFGMPFQEYLLRIRCEKARQALLVTNHTLLDICLACGFSDMKYFNKGFRRQYGCSPKEYRKSFAHADLQDQQKSMLTTQEFLSSATSLVVLDTYMESEHLKHQGNATVQDGSSS